MTESQITLPTGCDPLNAALGVLGPLSFYLSVPSLCCCQDLFIPGYVSLIQFLQITLCAVSFLLPY